MRIVYYIPSFGLGGVQKAACVLAESMARMGHPTTVVASAGGPRFQSNPLPGVNHRVVGSTDPDDTARELLRDDPQVIHLHAAAYPEELIARLQHFVGDDIRAGRRVLVATPVFGRPPLDRSLLAHTRTCCVGIYTFYRLARWLGFSGEEAIARGIAYVPLTPYQPPSEAVSTTDSPQLVAARRRSLGVNPAAFVVGRIGRNDPTKWHPATEQLVDRLLATHPAVHWLSIGLPDERGASVLAGKWRQRFSNLPETSDYALLTRALASMDAQVFFSVSGECFASSIAEAAGLGVPTIAFASPLKDNGQAEQVIEGVTGSLVGSIDAACRVVNEWFNRPGQLDLLKQSTQAYAHAHWHVDRVADDLLSMYDEWRKSPPRRSTQAEDRPAYFATMLREWRQFAATYRPNMVRLMGANRVARLRWRLLLAMVEWWPTFQVGRAIKQLRHRNKR